MRLSISVRRIRLVLLCVWFALVVLGFLAEAWKYLFFRRDHVDLVHFIGLSYEQNLPTWYSSSLLLLCAVQLSLIAVATRQHRAAYGRHWWLLAIAFAYISLDEAAGIHEGASGWFDFDGILYFGWVIPASVVVLLLAITYARFLRHLPRRSRVQFIAAGAIYVGGALGVEFLLGYWTDLAGTKNLVYGMIDLVEESMEILGATLFLCALTEYLARDDKLIKIDTAADFPHFDEGSKTPSDIAAGPS